MANPAPTINQINAFNATQGTTIDFNIIGGTELVRSNRIYIYDLSDNSLICTHLYVSTESIHELPANTDGSIVYESGKSSADFVNGAQYYAQIQTFTDIAGTEGGSGLSVAKMFWCLVDPTLTITTIPSTISTTSYNVSATYNANTNVVSNIIQQYQFNLYSATGSLLQSSGVIVGNGEQQGTSTTYDISYNFAGLSVGSSYYVVVEVTTTQGMSVSAQSNTFTVSIDTPTLGEATVVNNACDGYISVTSNLSSEYGGSGSGEIVSFETDSENVFTKLQVDLDPIQDLNGYDAPWVGGAGKNKLQVTATSQTVNDVTITVDTNGVITLNGTATASANVVINQTSVLADGTYIITGADDGQSGARYFLRSTRGLSGGQNVALTYDSGQALYLFLHIESGAVMTASNDKIYPMIRLASVSDATFAPYENICPISGHDEVDVVRTGKNLIKVSADSYDNSQACTSTVTDSGITVTATGNYARRMDAFNVVIGQTYTISFKGKSTGNNNAVYFCKSANLSGWNDRYSLKLLTATETEYTYTFTATTSVLAIGFYVTSNSSSGEMTITDLQLERGSTPTSYEPYQGQSYHQDIEATYTPTVQENEAYLFKQTGDVGGDRETIELVGGSVAWNQLVVRDGVNTTFRGITFTHNQNGTMRVNGTATERTYDYFGASASRQIYGNFVDHIFLVDVYGDNYPTGVSIETGLYNDNTYVNQINMSNNTRYKLYKIPANVNHLVTAGVVVNASLVGTAVDFTIGVNTFDLTQMFGSTIADYIYSLEQANTGDGVAFFRNLFPKSYYPYNAGELISVKTSSHNTVGKNLWQPFSGTSRGITFTPQDDGTVAISGTMSQDGWPQISKNYTLTELGWSVGDSFYVYVGDTEQIGSAVRFLDSGGTQISQISNNTSGTVPEGTVTVRIIQIGARSTVPLEGDVINTVGHFYVCRGTTAPTEWTPYTKNTYPLDADLELRGIPKLDASNNLYYDGDEYESDGTVTRKYGIVDLGDLTWTREQYDTTYRFRTSVSGLHGVPNTQVGVGICSCYSIISNNQQGIDKTEGTISYGSVSALFIIDNRYTSASDYKTAIAGQKLVYELATPTTETADAFEEIQICSPYGTEEFVDNRAVPIPVGNNTQYLTRDIYGGYIDLVSGLLTVDRAITSGALDWTRMSSSYQYGTFQSDAIADLKYSANSPMAICSCYAPSTAQAVESYDDGVIWARSSNGYRLVIKDTSKENMTAADFKTFMADKQIVYELATPQTYQLTPQQIQTLVGKNNVWSEQGEISLAYHIPITNLLVKRQDIADVSGSWLTLHSQPITQASDMDFTFIDFTNQYGKTYKYALVPLLTQTQSGVEVEVEGGYTVSDEVQSVFDGVFIVDSTGSQKCKANVAYGNVDMNQTVGTITPIGAKYPVVITNSKNQYHNGSISGTIVPDDYYFNGNLSRIDMVNKRDELEQFLTNKRAKIIKDWNGKIWLVMIMDNVSCTFNNNYGMGIVNFSTNWVEVGDPTNQQDLQATGLISVGGV